MEHNENIDSQSQASQNGDDFHNSHHFDVFIPSPGSITYPYRSLLATSFPRCHLVRTPDGGVESYVRALFQLGHGYPLWDPVGDNSRPESHIRDGIKIGDVGVVSREGYFDYYFNIFLPATDPVQFICPPDHEPLHPPPEAAETLVNLNHFPPGTALVSKGVTVSRHSESPIDIEFSTKAREAAMLVLPDGASRTDLVSTSRLLPYVKKHALSWYRFINNGRTDKVLMNGTLYLVTGHDSTKASSWAVASASQFGHLPGEKPMAHYRRANSDEPWIFSRGVYARADVESDPRMKNCAIFIRGLRIAVKSSSWTKHVLQNKPLRVVPHFNLLSTPILGFRAKVLTMTERQRDLTEDNKNLPIHTEVIFHPLSIVCRILLDESPAAAVAIAEDSMWPRATDTQTDGTLPEIVRELVKLLETHEIFADQGIVTLTRRTNLSKNTVHDARSAFFRIPDRLRQIFLSRRRRKEILRKVTKALPGPDYKEEVESA